MSDDQSKEQNGNDNTDDPYLTGRLLLAMPGMGDPRFERAVIYICSHDDQGAMGLVVNQILPQIRFDELVRQMNIPGIEQDTSIKMSGDIPVLKGGPVDTARGFVLHGDGFEKPDTIRIDNHFCITGTIDVLESIARGRGPADMLFMLGYAGWGAGQLDSEIRQNAWLVGDADPDLVFHTPYLEKWERTARKIGFDPAMLSSQAGRA